MSDPKKEYVLGTDRDELDRLGLQHRVWADAATAAWKRAGVGYGSRVLDLGCGPGHGSLDLAQLVGPQGQVVGLDASENFVNYANALAAARGYSKTQLQVLVGDAQNFAGGLNEVLGESQPHFDVVYCRWVLCWLEDPVQCLKEIHQVLKPGGRLVIHDYFNWQVMTTGPRSSAVTAMVNAAIESFEARQANLDIAADLPRLLREVGFQLRHFDVHQRVARGGGVDGTLAWPLTWWRSYGPKLVKLGFLSASDCEQAMADMDSLEADPEKFFFGPPVFEFIAVK